MTNTIKFKVARRCRWKLPKQHTADEWLAMLRSSPRGICFIEGLTFVEQKLCVVKYEAGAVFALPLALWPHPGFTIGLGAEDLRLADEWARQAKAGAFDAAIALRQREYDNGF